MANQTLFYFHPELGIGRMLFVVWTDAACLNFIEHAVNLEKRGNPGRFRWCCGLSEAFQQGNYDGVRRWIDTHGWMVQRLLSYQFIDIC